MNDSLLGKRIWLAWALAIIIVAAALAVRLYDLTDLPLDFHSTRQLHSFLIARGMYYEDKTGVPDWQKEMAVRQWKIEGLIEPQIMERLAAWSYEIAGSDVLWIPRLFSIFFWMIGAIPLFLLAKKLTNLDGALIALAFFLLNPYGAIASRAFQPDPLMTSAIIFSLWAGYNWYTKHTWRWAIAAGIIAGLTLYIKSTAGFFIGGAWLGLVLARALHPGEDDTGKFTDESRNGFIRYVMGSLRRFLGDAQMWVMGFLTLLPYIAYTLYGVYGSGLLEGQFSLRFFPQLWTDPVFYLRWNGKISSVVGFEYFIASLLGFLLLKRSGARWLFIGFWLGYFIYGMTLSHHISTHDYYQEPIIPIVALGVGALAALAFGKIQAKRWIALPFVSALILFTIVLNVWNVRVTLKRNDYSGEIEYWQEIGELVGHDTGVIGLTHDYGYRLEYWGWTIPANWMTNSDFELRKMAGQDYIVNDWFRDQIRGKDFFVVTLLDELESQPELKKILEKNYPVYKKGGDYIIYDLRATISQK